MSILKNDDADINGLMRDKKPTPPLMPEVIYAANGIYSSSAKALSSSLVKYTPYTRTDLCEELKTALIKANDELVELRKDKERLDWLENNHIEFAEELNRIGWMASNDAQWEHLKFLLRRLRFAIDSAIAAQEK